MTSILSFINLKIYDEKKYQKLEHDFRLMSVPQRKKHKNIFFLFLLTTILVAYSGGYPFSISGDIRSVPS